MKLIYNNPYLKHRRQTLRKNQTEVEKLLWFRLRNRQIQGFKFYRQYSIGPYILDFYCPTRKLGVELDGSQHKEANNIKYDEERKNYISNYQINILRFWDNEVMTNIEGVIEKIVEEVTHPNPLLK